MNWKKTLLICVLILITAGAVTTLIFSTEPKASVSGATKQTAMLVDVVEVRKGSFQPTIIATGTVQPAQDVMLSPRVSGEIISLSPAFSPGGFVRKGQVLLQIDPSDYETALRLRKSELSQAKAELELEMGRQQVARQDFELIGDTLAAKNKALVLREPQLNSVKASIEAAKANIKQAELNLQRTTVKAPFDAHILRRDVNVGSQVDPGQVLGRMVGVDQYWVVLNVPLSKLQWLSIPKNGRGKGSEVRLRNRSAWPEDVYRNGRVYQLVGALEDQTRLAQVLVTVSDPLAYRNPSPQKPPLIIGSFMEASIEAKEIEDVIKVNRDYVRDDETVWVMEENKLRIHDVDIVFQDAQYAYISSGLEEDDRVVTTNLTTVVDGAGLRLENPDTSLQEKPITENER